MRNGERFGDPNPRIVDPPWDGERDKQRNTRARFIQILAGESNKTQEQVPNKQQGFSALLPAALAAPLRLFCSWRNYKGGGEKRGKKKKSKRKDIKRPESSARFICISSPEGRGNPGKSFLVSADVQGFGGDVSWWPSAPWGCCGRG